MENIESLCPNIPNLEGIGYVKVSCRICGDERLYPPDFAKQFDSEHGLECMHCKRLMHLFGRI